MGVRFEEFRFADVFTVEQVNKVKVSGKNYVPDNEIISDDGTVPYIAAISTNNGITGYSSKYEANNKGDCITLSTTADSSNTVFYQPEDFIGRQQIAGIRRRDKQKMGKYVGLYIVAIVKRVTVLFNYGTKLTVGYLRDKLINLPIKVDALGIPEKDTECYYHKDGYIPDFEYMEKYIAELESERIAELEAERIAELEAYLVATGLNDYTLTDEDKQVLSLHNAEWGNKDRDNAVVDGVRFEEFEIGKLFKSQNGNFDIKKEHINGNGTPVITAGLENNGVLGKTDVSARIISANTITVDMFGYAFYRDFEYKMVTHARVFSLEPVNFKLSVGVGLYIVASLKWLSKRFSYSDMCSYNKIKKSNILLPIAKETDTTHKYHKDGYIPDFEFMERYIKAMQKVVIADVVKYKDEVIEKTKSIVGV